MGKDYSTAIVTDKSGTMGLAIYDRDLETLLSFLTANGVRQTAAHAAADVTVLTFGSDVTFEHLQTILKRYAEIS